MSIKTWWKQRNEAITEVRNTRSKTITATTPLEIAALRAIFDEAARGWYGKFTENAMRYLYKELGLENDDSGEQLDLDALSAIMVKWHRSVK